MQLVGKAAVKRSGVYVKPNEYEKDTNLGDLIMNKNQLKSPKWFLIES